MKGEQEECYMYQGAHYMYKYLKDIIHHYLILQRGTTSRR